MDPPSPSNFIYKATEGQPGLIPEVTQHNRCADTPCSSVPTPLQSPRPYPLSTIMSPPGLPAQSPRRDRTIPSPFFSVVNWQKRHPILSADPSSSLMKPSQECFQGSEGVSGPDFSPRVREEPVSPKYATKSPTISPPLRHALHSRQDQTRPLVGVMKTAPGLRRPRFVPVGEGKESQDASSSSNDVCSLASSLTGYPNSSLTCTTPSEACSLPDHILQEVRSVCLLATQRYLRAHAANRMARRHSRPSRANRFAPYSDSPHRFKLQRRRSSRSMSPTPSAYRGAGHGYRAGLKILLRNLPPETAIPCQTSPPQQESQADPQRAHGASRTTTPYLNGHRVSNSCMERESNSNLTVGYTYDQDHDRDSNPKQEEPPDYRRGHHSPHRHRNQAQQPGEEEKEEAKEESVLAEGEEELPVTSSLLTNTSTICSLLWHRAQRVKLYEVDAERRAAIRMGELLEWAASVTFYRIAASERGGEQERPQQMWQQHDRRGLEKGEGGREAKGVGGAKTAEDMLRAAKRLCRVLGDGDGAAVIKRMEDMFV